MQKLNKRNPNINRKQLKTTTFSMTMLIAVALIVSGFAGAVVVPNNSTNMNAKIIQPTNFIGLASENLPGRDAIAQTAPQPLQPTDYIHYDDGTNVNSIGLTAGGSFEYGVRFTPTELAAFDGYDLITVRHHHGWVSSTAPSVSGDINIYDEGTSGSPGALLHTEPYTTLAVPGWEEYTLSSSVTIDASKDLWICMSVTHVAGEYPAGAGPGPMVMDKGGFITLDGVTWDQIGLLGLDYNWNMWAGLEAGGPSGFEHDVGVKSIDSPDDGAANEDLPVEVTVKNFGNNTEIDVPVKVEIGQLASTTVFSEGFEDYVPSVPVFPPPGWSIQSTSTSTWYKYSTGYARCSEDNTAAQDEWLISETFDLSALSTAAISMYFYMATPNDDHVEVLGSIDDGVTWTNMIVDITGYMPSGIRTYDITSWAAGQSLVKIAWRWISTAPLTGSDYFYFREFKIGSPSYLASGVSEDFDGTWGPFGDIPPTGWNILDFGNEAVPTWNNNDWHNYYYSSFGSNCARVYYSPYESMDEWLISPTIDCTTLTDVDINFRQYFYFYATYPGYGNIMGSIDDGATWTETVVSQSITQTNGYYSFDISSWAAGESQVKIAFNYYAPGAQGRYWYIDDVLIGDIVEENWIWENYWFDAVIPDDWGPNGWMQEEVTTTTDTDPNIWKGAASGYATTPTGVSPYSGTYMAIYDTGLLFPNTASARLYTPPMDLSSYGATVVTLKFMIHINNYGSTYTDHLDVQVSIDGSTWTTIETIDTYDASNPGWVQQTIDLTAYASSTTFRLGFTGVDEGYRDIIIDDVVLEASTVILEYLDIEYVTVAVGEEETVVFSDFTPNDWQVAENTDIDYVVIAQTLLADDNPANNLKGDTVTLSYPFLHDTAVISIDSPARNTPGQTFPVQATIKNVGQFPSCCYLTNAEIGEKIPADLWQIITWSGATGTWLQYAYGANTYEPRDCGTGDYYAGCWYDQAVAFDVSFVTFAFDLTPAGSSATIELCEFFQDYAGYGQFGIYVHSGGMPDASGAGSSNYEETLYYETVDEIPRYGIYRTFNINPSLYADPSEVYLEFWYTDDGYINGWGAGIDGLAIPEIGYFEDFESDNFPPGSYSINVEYDEDVAAIILDPGEEATVTFPDWTPDQLAIGTSATIDYRTVVTSFNVDDTNPVNDAMSTDVTLDFWHDVLVQGITQPSMSRAAWDLLYSFDLEAATGALGNAGAEFDGTNFYSTRWAANLIHQYDITGVMTKEFSIPGVTGLRDLAYNENTGTFYGGAAGGTIWEMDFDSETLVSTISGGFQSRAIAYNPDDDVIYCSNWADPVWVVDPSSGAILDTINVAPATSTYGFAYDNEPGEDKMLYIFDQTIVGAECTVHQFNLDAGAMTGFTYNMNLDFPTISGIAGGLFIHSGFVPGKLVIGGLCQGTPDTMAVYELRGGTGPGPGGYPPIGIWLAPGTQSIEAIVANDGTFGETGLECSADILEFITNETVGTSVYNDSIPGIDLDPLGDTETCSFASYNFAIEGPYGLYLEIPLGNDDSPNNNVKEIGVGIDATAPTSSHALDPASPDGLAGWYVSDVTVTFTADDGTDDWCSGVKEIKFRVDGGSVQTIPGFTGTHVLDDDGEDIVVEYWAIDNVDNAGTHHTFEIDMDQTVPDIDLAYEVTGGSALEGWDFVFTATATDDMSDMNEVEFYLNDVLQDTVPGPGPIYQWGFKYYGGWAITIRATGYDIAGNDASDQLENPVSIPNSHSMPSSTVVNKVISVGAI